MAEQTWQDRYREMEERQNKLFARWDALLQAFCQTYNVSLSSLHGAANSVDDASETDNASDVVISTLLPFESDIRSSTGAAYNQRVGGVDDLCSNLATTEQKINTGKQEAINVSAVTTHAGKRKYSVDVVRRSGKEIVAIVPNRVSNSVVNPLMLGKSSDSRLPRDASLMVPTPWRFDFSIALPPPKPPDRVTEPTMMMNPPYQDINTAHPSPSNSIHLHGYSRQSSLPFQLPPQITSSVFNCHVFDEMPLRNRVQQIDIPHRFRNFMIRLGVFNTPDKLPPSEPPDCGFVSSSLPMLLLTDLYTTKEKGVGHDLTQLQSPGNFPSSLQQGRSSIFMNDKQVLLRFGNKISDHRDIADIDEYLLNLYCKSGDVETARQVIVEMPKMIGCVYNSHWEKYIAVDKLEAKDILSYNSLKSLRLVIINGGYEFNCLLDTPSRLPLLKPPDLIYGAMAIPLPPPKPPDRLGCTVVPAVVPKLPIEFSFISCMWGIEQYCFMKGIDKVLMHEYSYIEAIILGLHLLSGYACSIGIIIPAINSVLISLQMH